MADSKSTSTDKLKGEFQGLMSSLGAKAMDKVNGRVSGLTDKLTDVADGGPLSKAAGEGGKAAAQGKSPVGGALKGGLSGLKDKAKDAIPGMSGGGGGGGGKATKATIMIEEIDVGVPVSVAYNQWTEYEDWPDFMKKVKVAEQDDDEPTTTTHKAQVFWSHRSWESTIKEQVPDERILWRSQGEKGHVDGTVTFHEVAPRLTRILVVLEYYPQGLFERTGNLWRAQGRRARLELKHFRRHVMMNTALEPDSVTGWRGEIHDEEVAKSHDDVVEEEQQDEAAEDEYDEDESDDYEAEDEGEGGDEEEDEPEDEDEYDEEPEGEYEEEPEGEYEDDEPEEEEEEEPEEEEEEPEEPPRRTRKKSSSRNRK